MAPKPKGAATTARSPLQAGDVVCRIRPFAECGGHAEVGAEKSDQKTLDSWTDESVTIATAYMFSKGESCYRFPRRVFAPEATQTDVFQSMLLEGGGEGGGSPSLIDSFTGTGGAAPRNVLLLAYGQTGTGKTHTMFGTDRSLALSAVDDLQAQEEGWGVVPRVAKAVFERMAAGGSSYILSGSAVEFYCGFQTRDLLNKDRPVFIDLESHMPCGAMLTPLRDVADVLAFIDTVRTNRTARSTRMNQAEEGQGGGSSRSHCAFLLYLLQRDPQTDSVVRTHFSLVDLAGAERPGKTGEARKGSYEALVEASEEVTKGKKMSIGAQGMLINYELHMLRSAVVRAAECYTQGCRYNPENNVTTDLIKFVTGAFTGTSALQMLVCLSPSGANGWETWFSLEYGRDMATFRVPVKALPREPAATAWARAETVLRAALSKWKSTPESGTPASKYYAQRLGNAVLLAQQALELKQLGLDGAAADGSAGSGTGGSSAGVDVAAVFEELMAVDKRSFGQGIFGR